MHARTHTCVWDTYMRVCIILHTRTQASNCEMTSMHTAPLQKVLDCRLLYEFVNQQAQDKKVNAPKDLVLKLNEYNILRISLCQLLIIKLGNSMAGIVYMCLQRGSHQWETAKMNMEHCSRGQKYLQELKNLEIFKLDKKKFIQHTSIK